MRVVPRPRGKYNLIHYRHGDLKKEEGVRSWLDMANEIDTFLAPYRRPENATLCPLSSNRNSSTKDDGTVCLFDLNTIQSECLQSDYGYMAGNPCIYIVFNKINDWVPKAEPEGGSPTERVSQTIIGVECTGWLSFNYSLHL